MLIVSFRRWDADEGKVVIDTRTVHIVRLDEESGIAVKHLGDGVVELRVPRDGEGS